MTDNALTLLQEVLDDWSQFGYDNHYCKFCGYANGSIDDHREDCLIVRIRRYLGQG